MYLQHYVLQILFYLLVAVFEWWKLALKKKKKSQEVHSKKAADAFHIIMRCTSVILLHQKPNPPHLCLHPTFAFQKGAAGMPFLHIYIWLKAVNEHVMKIIMADLRQILYFEIISDSLITAVFTWQQMNRVIFYILRFSYSFKITNRLILCFSRLARKWLQMIWEYLTFIADPLI